MSGARAVARCDMLGVAPYSDIANKLYRGYLTPAYIAAQKAVSSWMIDAGMGVRIDAAGNLVGRYEGTASGPALIIGSHIDSVRDAGRYDGPLGVMLGIECIASLYSVGRRMPFPIEVYAFGDEEGSRFPTAMLTSRAVAGTLDAQLHDIADEAGVTLDEALRVYTASVGRETDPIGIDDYRSAKHASALAYLEAHIEQGPVLAAHCCPIATVTGIAAQVRFGCTVTGQTLREGTQAMSLPRDALVGAAAMILAAEDVARAGATDLVATVGRLEVNHHAADVLPNRAFFTLDIRAGTNADRDGAADAILTAFGHIAAGRSLIISHERLQDLAASPCDPVLMDFLDAAAAAQGVTPLRLVSGAGHDAMVMAALCPTAMLFIRCGEGISHNPAESVLPQDCEVALGTMLRFIEILGECSCERI